MQESKQASKQNNTIQYNTIQYNTIQYNTIQYNTIHIQNTIQIKNTNKHKYKQTSIRTSTQKRKRINMQDYSYASEQTDGQTIFKQTCKHTNKVIKGENINK
jgi:hypothetical protein